METPWVCLHVKSHSQYRVVRRYYLTGGTGGTEFFIPELLVRDKKVLPLPRNLFVRVGDFGQLERWALNATEVHGMFVTPTGAVARISDVEIERFREALLRKTFGPSNIGSGHRVVVVRGPLTGMCGCVESIVGEEAELQMEDSLHAKLFVPLKDLEAISSEGMDMALKSLVRGEGEWNEKAG